ncbi:MAG: DUF4440 domain-containing protein [Verrucomicrobia bacterium]|nr:MAG: DUF4440 domain-containing protein [Verrucomicrobiota bacterium]
MKALGFFILSVAITASLAVNGQIESSPATQGEAAAEQEIRGWLDHWRKAVSAKDVDRVMDLYTDDVVAYDLVPPLQYVGKPAYRGDWQQFFSQYDSDLHIETRDLHVGATGEFGYATGLQMISGTRKHGGKSGVWVRFTSLYRKVNGKWLDFHDHVSVPVDIEYGKALLDLKP